MNVNKTKVDDDWVWEIANSIRWLSQHFKEKFKIEKFLFGEIYATYHPILPDFIISLMEELGYDKEDNNDTDDNGAQSSLNSSAPASASGSPLATPVKPSPFKGSQPPTLAANNVSSFAASFTSQYSNNLTFTGGISSLFEDLSSQTIQNSQTTNVNASSIFNDSNENDDNNNTTLTNNQSNENNSDDVLDEFKKKKP